MVKIIHEAEQPYTMIRADKNYIMYQHVNVE